MSATVPNLMKETIEALVARIVIEENGIVHANIANLDSVPTVVVVVTFGDKRHGTRLDMANPDCLKRALADAIWWRTQDKQRTG